jgi:putative tryptophan/tyrosine transport system substrate-binding protein
MKRRAFVLVILGSGTSAAAPPVHAQKPKTHALIACVTPVSRSAVQWLALIDELRRHGFAEGDNLEIIGFDLPADRLDENAAALVEHAPDAIVAGGVAPTRAAQRATSTIPILTALDDFVAQHFVASLAHPGGNITGVSLFGPELNGKRQETLLELLPNAHRIALLIDPASTPKSEVDKLVAAARLHGVETSAHFVAKPEDIAPAVAAARAVGAQGINVLASQLFYANHREIQARVSNARLPAIYQWSEWVAEGGAVSYGPRFTNVYRQIARQLVKVLDGTRPADLPVEQPTQFELAINTKTLKALGIAAPPLLLARADEVID